MNKPLTPAIESVATSIASLAATVKAEDGTVDKLATERAYRLAYSKVLRTLGLAGTPRNAPSVEDFAPYFNAIHLAMGARSVAPLGSVQYGAGLALIQDSGADIGTMPRVTARVRAAIDAAGSPVVVIMGANKFASASLQRKEGWTPAPVAAAPQAPTQPAPAAPPAPVAAAPQEHGKKKKGPFG